MPKYRRGSGSIYKRGKFWWIAFYADGKQVCESAKTTDRAKAREKLQEKLGKMAAGEYFVSAERVLFEELADDMIDDYKANAKRSLKDAERSVKVLRMFFGGQRAQSIKPAEILKFRKMRLNKLSNASVNRELAALKRIFNLGIEHEKIYRKPKIHMLAENNARQGFFEWGDFVKVWNKLPEYLKAPMTFAYFTGWRVRSEVLKMTWPQLDLDMGIARLEVGTTKNKRGRLTYLLPELRAMLEKLHSKNNIGLVFHNEGRRIANYYKAWHKACKDAKVERIPHDFRRTAVRNLVRAGVPEHTAMIMTGHKTRSVFDRYDIVNEGDLKEAAEKLTTFSTTLQSQTTEEPSQRLENTEDATLAQTVEQLIRNQ